MRFHGYYQFKSVATYVHVQSDNGYSFKFCNSEKICQTINRYSKAVFDDVIEFKVEPGWYYIEGQYFNDGGNAYFTWEEQNASDRTKRVLQDPNNFLGFPDN